MKVQEMRTMKPWLRDTVIRFVDMKLGSDGGVNRRDIMDHFGVSVVTASKYMKMYRETHPDTLRYDPSTKRYVMVLSTRVDGTVAFSDVCDMIIPVGAWLEQEHIRYIKALGRNPDDYTSEFSLAADALRNCLRKVRYGRT